MRQFLPEDKKFPYEEPAPAIAVKTGKGRCFMHIAVSTETTKRER